jgi:hypothetical protein
VYLDSRGGQLYSPFRAMAPDKWIYFHPMISGLRQPNPVFRDDVTANAVGTRKTSYSPLVRRLIPMAPFGEGQ